MKKQLRIFMSGALFLIPIAATIWVIGWIGGMLGGVGVSVLKQIGVGKQLEQQYGDWIYAIGVVVVIAVVYMVGLLANLWLFRGLFKLVDRTLSRVPGIKTIYESVRDLLKLFGGESGRMGRPVLYRPPGMDVKFLGIVTNEHPQGRPEGDDSVIVYLPLGYMIGGPILYVHPDQLEPIDMPVETALKLAATAFVGSVTPSGEVKLPGRTPPGVQEQ